jgi:Dyp-type peroxidase family
MNRQVREVDYADIQGLVRYGYKHLPRAAYVLVRVKDAAAARAWLRTAQVTYASPQSPPPSTALNVAVTAAGLAKLGVAQAVIDEFSYEFRGGMAEPSRARQLGDAGVNSPDLWRWGGAEHNLPHLAVMFFATADSFDPFFSAAKGENWLPAFEELATLETHGVGTSEPFGFADGISQPQLDWEQQRDTTWPQYEYNNVAALGEFLLGYLNEYGRITPRPLLDSNAATANLLPAADGNKKDLGINGSYLVIRQLEQDVRRFWQFIYRESNGDATTAELLASQMVGRTPSGTPLMPAQSKPIPGVDPEKVPSNNFTYAGDPSGTRCPFGAHVRRANPRTADFPKPLSFVGKILSMIGLGEKGLYEDLVSPVRYHRLLRRGRKYGPELSPDEARNPPTVNEPDRGLVFVALNANISRQFEFVQNAWIRYSKFNSLTGETDPLLGNRLPIPGCPVTSDFTIPVENGLRRRVADVPQFVTVRGGAYFFLPSLRALRYFAGAD